MNRARGIYINIFINIYINVFKYVNESINQILLTHLRPLNAIIVDSIEYMIWECIRISVLPIRNTFMHKKMHNLFFRLICSTYGWNTLILKDFWQTFLWYVTYLSIYTQKKVTKYKVIYIFLLGKNGYSYDFQNTHVKNE